MTCLRRMKAQEAEETFLTFIQNHGFQLNQLYPSNAINLMLAFYEEVRAEECDLEADGDMLLFQWGSYSWNKNQQFEYSLTRQLIFPQKYEEGGEMWEENGIWQLSLTLKYPLQQNLQELDSGNEWCFSPTQLAEFREFVAQHQVTQLLKDISPAVVELDYCQQ